LNHFYSNKIKYPEANQGNSDKLQAIFKVYADKEDDSVMGEEGMLQL